MLAMMAVIGVALAYEHDTQHPSHGHGHGYPQHGGHSNTFRKQDDHGNYAFGYEIKDPKGAQNYRKESGDAHGNVHGSYGLQDIDGRWRVVNYVADKVHGFRAKIETNEPGTGNADTAAVIINGADQHGGSKTSVAAGHHAPNYNDGGHQDGPAYKKAASA
ncbi:Adult-specific rigid cuticular protein 15.7 [Halotydeus destructor]|nr:Adult-specific rigid cuticular protein 15.7 [Halotydeus destructor]